MEPSDTSYVMNFDLNSHDAPKEMPFSNSIKNFEHLSSTTLDNEAFGIPSSPPQMLVTSYSPDEWEPQVIDKSNVSSSYTSPTSSEFSHGNSYVTAEEKTPGYNLNNDEREFFSSKSGEPSLGLVSEEKDHSSDASYTLSSGVDLSLSEPLSLSTDVTSNESQTSMSLSPSTEVESSSSASPLSSMTETSDKTHSSPLSMCLSPCTTDNGGGGGIVPSIQITLGSIPNDLKKICAPKLDLNWSLETEHEDGDRDSLEDSGRIPSVDNLAPKKRISFNREILVSEDLNYDSDVDVATEAQEGIHDTKLIEEERSSPMMTNSIIPPPEISQLPPPPDLIPKLTSAEEFSELQHWRNVVIGGAWRRIDMRSIAPYRKCISHGGYTEDIQSPIVVLSAALLPEKSRKNYHYIMDNLFMYVLSFVEQLAADDYVLVYFSGGSENGSGPGFHWMRRAYEMIDRRLRKNLKSLLLVHPSLWAKTILTLSRPFISSKFYRKLTYVPNLTNLAQLIPLEQLEIPDLVKQADFQLMIRERKKVKR